MRPVATQSCFTTPWLGNVFWLIQLLRPFGSGVQLFQAFGLGSQLFQTFGLGNQLFQSFGSAISFSSFCHRSEMDWMLAEIVEHDTPPKGRDASIVPNFQALRSKSLATTQQKS